MMTIPPDPERMNNKRAEWALIALEAFGEAARTEHEEALADLLCGLMHLCDRRGNRIGNFERRLEWARGYYRDETAA